MLKKQIWQFNQWRSRFDRRVIKLDPVFCSMAGLLFNEINCRNVKEAWDEDGMFFLRVRGATYQLFPDNILPESLNVAIKLTQQRPLFWW